MHAHICMRVVKYACTGKKTRRTHSMQNKITDTPPPSVSVLGGTSVSQTVSPAASPDWAGSTCPLLTHRGLSGHQPRRPAGPRSGRRALRQGPNETRMTAGGHLCTAGAAAAPSPCPAPRGSGRRLLRAGEWSDGRRNADGTTGCAGVGFSPVNELRLLTQAPCVPLVPGEEAG